MITIKTKKGYLKSVEPYTFTKDRAEAKAYKDTRGCNSFLKDLKMKYGKIEIIILPKEKKKNEKED